MTQNRKKVAFTFSEITDEVRNMSPQERTTEIDVIAIGQWSHPFYGNIEVTMETLQEIISNFKSNSRKIDLAIDYGHNSGEEAAGWIRDLYIVGDRIKALVEWTIEGYQKIRDGEYKYFSPEVVLEEGEIDPSTGTIVRNILIGGGITNRPFFKGLQALKASEMANGGENGGYSLFLNSATMKKFSEIKEGLASLTKISAEQIAEARLSFSELPQEEQDAAKADLESLEAKVENESDPKTDPAPADPQSDPAPQDPTPPVDPTPAPAGEAGKTFSEESFSKLFSEFGIKTPEELHKRFSELQKEKILAGIEKDVSSKIFSESNKTAPFLDKAKPALMSFHEKFGALAFSEMLKIIDKSNLAPSALIFSEVGKGQGDPAVDNPMESIARKAFTECPEGTDPKANAKFEVAKAFAEKRGGDFSKYTAEASQFVEGLSLDV